MTTLPVLAHAELGASKAERWINCPGSIKLGRGLPEVKSIYAIEGTAAHSLAARALKKGLDADTWLDSYIEAEGEKVLVTEEMCEAIQTYLDYVRGQRDILNADMLVETAFNLAPLNPPGDMWGTADTVLVAGGGCFIECIDLKYGVGVVVDADENEQLMFYVLGAVVALYGKDKLTVKPENFRIVIVQPRGFHPDGIIRTFEFDYERLIEFKTTLFECARRTGDPNAALKVGSWCKFCPALAVCPEQEKNAIEVAQAEFQAMPVSMPPAPEKLTTDELTTVLNKAYIIEDWLNAVRGYVQTLLEAEEAVPGWKLVERRATRKWKNETNAAAWAAEHGVPEPFTKKFMSPAQMEKALREEKGGTKKAAVDLLAKSELVVKVSSGNTIAPTKDSRPAVALTSAEDEFTALPAGSTPEE